MATTFIVMHSLPRTLCSRNFQNVKLRLDFVERSFYRHSEFTWNPILAYSNRWKMSFLAMLELLNFDFFFFSEFEQVSSPKFTKNSKFRVSKIAKNDTFGLFEIAKIWLHVKFEWQANCKISLTSHFESFWSIVLSILGSG